MPTRVTKEQLYHLIQQSDIPTQDKANLIRFFGGAGDQVVFDAFRLFSEHPDWIPKINDIYNAKRQSFLLNDAQLLEQILAREEAFLKELD